MEVAVLANPWSGRGSGPRRAQAIVDDLQRRGWRARIHIGESRTATVNWGRAVPGTADRIVVVGGDGTLNAVVEGLIDSAQAALPPVLQVGLGTANLLSHELKLPRRAARLAEVVREGAIQPFDLGRVTLAPGAGCPAGPRPALLVWDFGLGGALMQAMDEVRDGPIRKLDYAGLLWKLLRRWQPQPQRVIADGRDLGCFEYGIVTNIRTYASSAFRFPPTEYDDGRWELYLFPRVNARLIASLAARAALRRLEGTPGMVRARAAEVRVAGEQPTPVEIDGDWYGATPVEFRVEDRQIPILRPPRRP